jgi:hypothetical protein
MLSPLLTAEPFAPCAGAAARLLKAAQPLLLVGLLLWHGALAALATQLRAALAGAPAQLLRPAAWRDALLARAMPVLLAASDETWAPVKRDLVAHAHGSVLEVGAGSGMTLKYYRRSEVRRCAEGQRDGPLQWWASAAWRGKTAASARVHLPHVCSAAAPAPAAPLTRP